MSAMPDKHSRFATAQGIGSDATQIVDLSSRVQAALTASGSLQEIGPLQRTTVSKAIEERRCWVLKDEHLSVFGCAFTKETGVDWYHQNDDFSIQSFKQPWLFLHSIMLDPELQGRGIGMLFFHDVVKEVETFGGTILLDCWAGSDKLRNFYERAGCRYVATIPENDYEIAVFVWPP